MEEREPIILDVQIDEQGNWQTMLEQEIGQGAHAVVAETESGQQDKAVFSVHKIPEPTIIEKIQTTGIPYLLIWFSLLFLIIAIILFLNNIRLRKKLKKLLEKLKILKSQSEIGEQTEPETHDEKLSKRMKITAIVAIAIIITSMLLAAAIHYDLAGRLGFGIQKERIIEQVSGTVLTPFTLTGVEGVDLKIGDVSVKTSASGNFSFANVSSLGVIRITHPDLAKALFVRVDDKTMEIWFDADMYRTLTQIIDFDSRQKFAEIYDNYLHEDIKIRLKQAQFIKFRKSIYNAENIADQEIFISKIEANSSWKSEVSDERFQRVIAITVEANNQKDTYFMSQTDTGWKLVF